MWRSARVFGCVLALAGCGNAFTGNLTPVPPVHRVPSVAVGTVVLLDADADIETKDPTHIQRAKDQRVPQDYRAAMVEALGLAGFAVTADASRPHSLHAKLALAVSEDGFSVRQTYRCGMLDSSDALVSQIDWTWPNGTYVDTEEVYRFATHNLATEVATNRRLLAWLERPTPRETRP